MKYRDFVRVLERHGFVLARQRGSHRTYKGEIAGRTQVVTVAYHSGNDDILPKTFASMIRQSGLPRSAFR